MRDRNGASRDRCIESLGPALVENSVAHGEMLELGNNSVGAQAVRAPCTTDPFPSRSEQATAKRRPAGTSIVIACVVIACESVHDGQGP